MVTSPLLINNIKFEHSGYSINENTLSIAVVASSIDDIEQAIGESAIIDINNGEYKAQDMVLYRVSKEYRDDANIFIIDLIQAGLNNRINNNAEKISAIADEIEIINNAIVELAEIIGGNE